MSASASVLRPRRDRFGAVVIASASAHAIVLALALAFRPAPLIDLEQKPIVARLVRLGEKRAEHLLPRKEQAPEPPPHEPVAAPAPVPPAPAAAPAPVGAAPKPRPAPPPRGSRGDAFSAAVSRMRREALREPTYGDPGGDPLGDASEGQEGDRYRALVERALRDVYRLPATIPERERLQLRATLVLYLEPDGRVSRFAFESRSGNPAFDDALERAVRQARIPPPPAEMRRLYRQQGLGVNFSASP